MKLNFCPEILSKRSTAIRFLAYTNYANIGDSHQAIEQYQYERPAGENIQAPNIDDHLQYVSIKYGFGLNIEQKITKRLRAY
jgi:hypothetical protein